MSEVASGTDGAGPVVVAEVTREAIAAVDLAARVATARAGAVGTFEGVVRDHHRGRTVVHLEYEAYVPMAERVLREILDDAATRWPIERIGALHRIGRLEIGDVSVAIAVAAAHRGAAFDALRYAIDTIKAQAPIWKRESGPDGAFWIEGPEHIADQR